MGGSLAPSGEGVGLLRDEGPARVLQAGPLTCLYVVVCCCILLYFVVLCCFVVLCVCVFVCLLFFVVFPPPPLQAGPLTACPTAWPPGRPAACLPGPVLVINSSLLDNSSALMIPITTSNDFRWNQTCTDVPGRLAAWPPGRLAASPHSYRK